MQPQTYGALGSSTDEFSRQQQACHTPVTSEHVLQPDKQCQQISNLLLGDVQPCILATVGAHVCMLQAQFELQTRYPVQPLLQGAEAPSCRCHCSGSHRLVRPILEDRMPVRMTLFLATMRRSSALLPPTAPADPNSPVRSMLMLMSWNILSIVSTSLLTCRQHSRLPVKLAVPGHAYDDDLQALQHHAQLLADLYATLGLRTACAGALLTLIRMLESWPTPFPLHLPLLRAFTSRKSCSLVLMTEHRLQASRYDSTCVFHKLAWLNTLSHMSNRADSHLIEMQGDCLRQQVRNGLDLVRLRVLQHNGVRVQLERLVQPMLYLHPELCTAPNSSDQAIVNG